LKVLFVSSEVAPFAKTGGLGDVAAALPKALKASGHDVRVVMPLYSRVARIVPGLQLEQVVGDFAVALGPGLRVHVSILAHGNVYFVRCPALYGREAIYSTDHDEHLRFVVLQWAALILCQRLGFSPDIVHCNDWQTSLVPLLLRTMFAWDRLFSPTRTVLTIHNIGHQGTFGAGTLAETGLADAAHHFHQDQLREDRLNFLLTGILYANAITTVSPTYAREIQTPEHGVGLDAFLRDRKSILFGVLNGIDEDEWSPERDTKIPHRYSVDDLSGKERNKQALLASANLPFLPDVPVIGIVSRLAWQKGFDLCFGVLPRVLSQHRVQLVVLGTGEPKYEDLFSTLARRFPRQVAYLRKFSEPVAHLIEAGSDMFLMPSRYEPCGLNQMYSLRYGTLPIVHHTGGLADTVHDDNGFVFHHFDEAGLRWAITRALSVWNTPEWTRLQRNAMRGRFSWSDRVVAYEQIYRLIAPGR
jgi:starch synthase